MEGMKENKPAVAVPSDAHAHWVRFVTAGGLITKVRCSACGDVELLSFENKPFCPGCGSPMDQSV